MVVVTRGELSLSLGIVKLSANLADADRQSAWQLYTELSTRVAVTGRPHDSECSEFDGEVLIESLDSLYGFFMQARNIMKQYPVGRFTEDGERHLGMLVQDMLGNIVRPFLTRWQSGFRHWWMHESDARLPPIERQQAFPHLAEFLDAWSAVRWLLRRSCMHVAEQFGFPPPFPGERVAS